MLPVTIHRSPTGVMTENAVCPVIVSIASLCALLSVPLVDDHSNSWGSAFALAPMSMSNQPTPAN